MRIFWKLGCILYVVSVTWNKQMKTSRILSDSERSKGLEFWLCFVLLQSRATLVGHAGVSCPSVLKTSFLKKKKCNRINVKMGENYLLYLQSILLLLLLLLLFCFVFSNFKFLFFMIFFFLVFVNMRSYGKKFQTTSPLKIHNRFAPHNYVY